MDLLPPEKYMWHLLYCYGNWKKCLTIGVLILNSHCKVFILKDPVPDRLFSHVVYKFVCAGCNACYNGNALLLVPKTSALDIQHWALKLFLHLHSYLLWEQFYIHLLGSVLFGPWAPSVIKTPLYTWSKLKKSSPLEINGIPIIVHYGN